MSTDSPQAEITEADRAAAHDLLDRMGRAWCAHGNHTGDCDSMSHLFANHAASARAEERRECLKVAQDAAKSWADVNEQSKVGDDIGATEIASLNRHLEAESIAAAISRRSP